MTRALFLDCDTGIDDALALGLLLASPAVDLVGVGTVSGNTSAAQAARNTLDLLALLDRYDVPVAVGEHHPRRGGFDGGTVAVHGGNGIGGVVLPRSATEPSPAHAADLLVAEARRRPGELHVLAVGPLTNLARALEIEPGLPDLVDGLTAMGGAVWVPGNRTGRAEANIATDPEAAEVVLSASWPVTLVPLDVTLQHLLGPDDQAALAAAGHPFTDALAAMLTTYLDFYEGFLGERRAGLHDPLAALVATGAVTPTLRRTGLAVDTSAGPDRGRTGPTDEPIAPGVDVVTAVPEPVADLVRDGLLALVRGAAS